MFVCLCHAVTDREIRQAVDNGVAHVDELGALCGVGTGCGNCRSFAQELIENRRSEEIRAYAA